MKNILVPTDFSFYAELAADAAMMIAKEVGSHIHFYHNTDFPAGWEELPEKTKASDLKRVEEEKEIVRQLTNLVDRGKKAGISCSFGYNSGKLITNLKNAILRADYDLILMGSHGASGKEEYFIGSNAQKMIRKIHLPVMVIKSPLADVTFEKVLFATGLATSDLESFDEFLRLVRPFKPKEIHIMAVDTSSYFSQPTIIMKEALKMFQERAEGYKTSTHFYRDYSVEAGIRHFCDEVGIELVGISNRERNAFKRMLQGSNVEMLVNHSSVPVLSIDY